MKHGFVKVAAAVPYVHVADCYYNIERISEMVHQADAQGVEIVTFPELSITGYTCGDLFCNPSCSKKPMRLCVNWPKILPMPRY